MANKETEKLEAKKKKKRQLGALEKVGAYVQLMVKTFALPDKWSMFFRQYFTEVVNLGVNSILIDILISFFIGAAMTIQMKLNMSNPLLPEYLTGYAVRECLLLEFSPTVLGLVLAGKVGSSIASELGTMRITEQIDALDIMGVNSANYLIFPKIMAFVTFIPCLVIISIASGLLGGAFLAKFTDTITMHEYIYGIQFAFTPFYVTYAIIKSLVFAFIISSVASFYGYSVKGRALEVGKSSTDSVVNSSVIILVSNIMLTNLLLQ